MKWTFLIVALCATGINLESSPADLAEAVASALQTVHNSPSAGDPIANIRKTLVPFEVLKGGFHQSKTIKILKSPLKSHGTFTLAKGKGLLWRSEKPIPSLLLITRDDIASLKDGKKTVFVSMKEQPGLRIIGQILFAVFAADVNELQRHFKFIDPMCDSGHWSVYLTPNDPSVAKAIREIHIQGSRTVQSLTLSERNGDETKIEFLDVSEKKPLTKEEEALFE